MVIGVTKPADDQVTAKPMLALSLSPVVLSVIPVKSMMPFTEQDGEREREKERQKKEPGAHLRTRCGSEGSLGGSTFGRPQRELCSPTCLPEGSVIPSAPWSVLPLSVHLSVGRVTPSKGTGVLSPFGLTEHTQGCIPFASPEANQIHGILLKVLQPGKKASISARQGFRAPP